MTQTPPPHGTDFYPRQTERTAAKKKLFGRLPAPPWAVIGAVVLALVVGGSLLVFGRGKSPQYKAGYEMGQFAWTAFIDNGGSPGANFTPTKLYVASLGVIVDGGQVPHGLTSHSTKAQVQRWVDGCAAAVAKEMNH